MSDMAAQRSALHAARLLRGDYLVAVAEGLILPEDLIRAAGLPNHQALRVVSLKDLFSSPPKPGVRWPVLRTRLLAALSLDPATPDAKLTVGWLLDPRAGGRRWYALRDATRPRDDVPWEQLLWL